MYQKLQRNFDVIQYLVKNASPGHMNWRAKESGWSLGQIIEHLREVEKWHACLLLPDMGCVGETCLPPAFSNNARQSPPSGRVFQEYARYRQTTVTRLRGATADQWQRRTAHDARAGPVTLAHFVEKIDAHDRMHINQMEQILRAMPLNPLLTRALYEISDYHRCYRRHLADARTLLDIGVGPGLALRHVMRQNPHLTAAGVDIRDLRLPGVEVPLQVYDGHTLPFEANQFDVSLLFYVLHHCQDPRRVLSEATRVTRRKLLIIEEFGQAHVDPVSLDLTERQSHQALGIPPDLPYQLFDKAELAAMLQDHNLWTLDHQHLSSQTSRPVRKYLYVLAKDM